MKHVGERLLDRLIAVDGLQRQVLVAEHLASGGLLAIAEMERTSATSAEVAFIVDDRAHGNGLATMMLQRLAQAARETGFTGLTALTLAENACMLDEVRHGGLPVTVHFDGPQARVTIDLTGAGVERLPHPVPTARSGPTARG